VVFSILVGFGIGLAAAWVALGAVVLALRTPGQSIGELLLVFPDSLRLTAALYRDRTLPASVRRRLRIALVYNIQPVNIIPDAIPVIGFADNVAVLAWALRGAVRIAGLDAVERHWKGSPESLAVLYRALRLSYGQAGRSAEQEWA
jgi:uncharacterized membrane protein YkvA (DUF1232 family)